MGLKDTFQNAAVTILNVAGDVRKDVRYLSHVSTFYDASSGVTSVIGRSYFFSMLFEDYMQSEVDNVRIMPTDVKATIAQKSLGNLVPTTQDTVNICEAYGSTEYEVRDIGTDPADATWVFQLRARGKGSL